MLARLIGDIGVSTFSVLSFIYSLANAILSGVAQDLQPLFGLFVKDIEKSFPHFFADRSFSSSRMTLSLMRSVLV